MVQSDEMVSPEAYRTACEQRDRAEGGRDTALEEVARLSERIAKLEAMTEERDAFAERVEVLTARIGGAATEAARYLELATRLEGEHDQARAEVADLREQLVAIRHRDLLGRASTGAQPNGLHLERWAELVLAGWVRFDGGVYVLTAAGEEVWRG